MTSWSLTSGTCPPSQISMATEVPGPVVSGQNFLGVQFTYSPLLHFIFLDYFSLETHSESSSHSHHVLITPLILHQTFIALSPNLSTTVIRHYRHPDGRRSRPNTLRAPSAPVLVAHKEEVHCVLLDYFRDRYLGSAVDSVLVSLVPHRSIAQHRYVLRGGTNTPVQVANFDVQSSRSLPHRLEESRSSNTSTAFIIYSAKAHAPGP